MTNEVTTRQNTTVKPAASIIKIEGNRKELIAALRAVIPFASLDEDKQTLCGIQLEAREDKGPNAPYLRFVATDGYTLGLVDVHGAAFMSGRNGMISIDSAKLWLATAKATKTNEIVLSCEPIAEVNFPNYKRTIPDQHNNETKLPNINVLYFKRLADSAVIVAKSLGLTLGGRACPLHLECNGKLGVVAVRVPRGIDGFKSGYGTAAIFITMPMRKD